MSNILIIAEQEDGKVKKYTKELAGKAAELAASTGGTLTALWVGSSKAQASELGKFGVNKVVAAVDDGLNNYSSEKYADVLAGVISQENSTVVLATASSLGTDLLARVAARLKAGLANDCIELAIEDGKLKARRPVFAGKAQVDVTINTPIQMATSRPNSYPTPEANSADAEIVDFVVNPSESRTTVKEVITAESDMIDLVEADRIVSGGRAMANSENFAILSELAACIGATVGASRAAVDAGYISHDHQVGQTGKTVNPSLYIACGIPEQFNT